jgi:peptide/nickel transport system permease protein
LSDLSIIALEPSPDPMAGETDQAEGIVVDSRSPARMAARRFLHHKAAVAGSITLIIITMAVVLAPWIAPYGETQLVGDPRTETINFLPPQAAYWFGTDSIGRDMYSLILWGGRISLFIGVAVAISASIIGTLVGAFAGFRGGKFDDFLMRFTDLFLAFPLLVALLVIRQLPSKQAWAATAFGDTKSIRLTITLLVLVSWMGTARIVRGQVLSLKEKEFIEAGRAMGATNWRLISRHLIPNCIGPIIVAATFTVAAAIITESTLSFFGFGVQPPHVSWGNLLAGSKSYVGQGKWWLVLFPSLALLFTVLAVNFIGDGLRDALDPKQAKERN